MEYERWSDFCGKIRIFKNEFEDGKKTFVTSISSKNEEGKYENMYLPVSFKKTIDVSSLGDEIVAKGFITFYKTQIENKDGETIEIKKPKLVVMEIIDNGTIEKFVTIDDADDLDELPF